MSNYFDNQDKWSWQVNDDGVKVFTDHGDHTHTVDVSKVPIGEMADNTGKTMGDAHRAASHDFKKTEDKQMSKESFNDRIKVDDDTKAKLDQVSKEWGQQQQNNQKQSKNGNQDNGRERGNEGPGSQGRNADLKHGSKNQPQPGKTGQSSKVTNMRVSMSNNTQSSQSSKVSGKLSQNGQAVNNSGKTMAPSTHGNAVSTGGKASAPTPSGGHGNGTTGGHGNGSGGGLGGSGGHGGHGGSSGGGLGGSSGGHGGHGGSSGGGMGGH